MRAMTQTDIARKIAIARGFHVDEPRDAHGRWSLVGAAGRDLSDWAEGKDGSKTLAKANRATNPMDPGDNHGTKDYGDLVLKAVAHEQGWDKPGRTGTSAELDQLVAHGGVEMFRGVAGRRYPEEHQPARILERMRTGPLEYGQGGYGNGWYASPRQDVALQHGAPDGKGGIDPASIQRMVLHPDARVADYDTLRTQMRAWIKEHEGRGQRTPEGLGIDLGRFAAMLGYDAIRVHGQHDANSPTFADQYVLLNRGAVLFQEPGQ